MVENKKIPMAIAYDFDGTLSPDYMQNYGFIPDLGVKDPQEFWDEVRENARLNDMDEILSYMELMLEKARNKNLKFNYSKFNEYGKGIDLFPGVVEWFNNINSFADTQNIKIEHYIISSGLKEMIEGTPLKEYFKYIFASKFKYDQHDVAMWPALAVNYTNKTQYLFRINKGITNSYDNETINKYIPNDQRPVPFTNMIYIGDGETDVPSMKMMRYQKGYAIAVYNIDNPGTLEKAQLLINQDRADYAFPADYRYQSDLYNAVIQIIEKIAIENRLLKFKKLGNNNNSNPDII